MTARPRLARRPAFAEIGLGLVRTASAPHFHDTYTVSLFDGPAVIHCRGRAPLASVSTTS